jgi:TetR/AcrR family transcriptional regulator
MTQANSLVVSGTRPLGRPARESETRQHILDCAEAMFDERGYDGVTIRDLIKETVVKSPTIYYYFGDKEGLFVEVVRRKLDRLYRRMQMALQVSDTRSRLVELAIVFLSSTGDRVALTRDALTIRRLNETSPTSSDKIKPLLQALNVGVIGTAERIMREGIRRGDIKEKVDPNLYGRAFLHLVEGFANDPVTNLPLSATPEEQRELAQKLVVLFLEGSAAIPLQDFNKI